MKREVGGSGEVESTKYKENGHLHVPMMTRLRSVAPDLSVRGLKTWANGCAILNVVRVVWVEVVRPGRQQRLGACTGHSLTPPWV